MNPYENPFNSDNPEILSNIDIEHLCKILNIPLILCVSKNKLKNYKPINGGYIINLMDSGGGGSHWVALWIQDNNAVYFDSFGKIYPYDVKKFIKNKKFYYNTDQIQHLQQESCGYFCIFFLYMMNSNKHLYARTLLNRFINLFSDDESDNDNILQKYLKNIIKKEKILL
jgi:hypothetical protein